MASDSFAQIAILSAIALLCSCLIMSVNAGEISESNAFDFTFSGGESASLMPRNCDADSIGGCVELANPWSRRRLLQQSGPYYISYGSLTADRVPCPPMSGRSYYNPNCDNASGPADPYERGCSVITRCARDSG